jgi:regulatory protein
VQAAIKLALRLLKARDRSEAELRRRLEEKGVPAGEVGDVLRRLREKRLLDDERTARNWTESALRAGHGPERIRATLRSRGVEAPAEMSAAEEERRAWEALVKRAARLQGLGVEAQARRLSSFLAGRGYSSECVERVIEKFLNEGSR